MAQANIKFIELESINSTAIHGGYEPLNPTGLTAACSMIMIQNETTKDVTVSLDGVTAHLYLPSGSESFLPLQFNNQPNANEALLSKGTIFYVKGLTGTGFVYLSGFYV